MLWFPPSTSFFSPLVFQVTRPNQKVDYCCCCPCAIFSYPISHTCSVKKYIGNRWRRWNEKRKKKGRGCHTTNFLERKGNTFSSSAAPFFLFLTRVSRRPCTKLRHISKKINLWASIGEIAFVDVSPPFQTPYTYHVLTIFFHKPPKPPPPPPSQNEG